MSSLGSLVRIASLYRSIRLPKAILFLRAILFLSLTSKYGNTFSLSTQKMVSFKSSSLGAAEKKGQVVFRLDFINIRLSEAEVAVADNMTRRRFRA